MLTDVPFEVLTDRGAYLRHYGLSKADRLSVVARIERDTHHCPATGCALLDRADQGTGYIQIKLGDGGRVLAHRMVWALEHGEWPPDDMVVMHTCDTTVCIAPWHLVLGTHQDNMDDMVKKGRSVVKPSLKTPQIRAIRQLYRDGVPVYKIARRLGHTKPTVKLYCGLV